MINRHSSTYKLVSLFKRPTYASYCPGLPPTKLALSVFEKGDPSVAMGHYATVLFSLGMAERLADLADPRYDTVGLTFGSTDLALQVAEYFELTQPQTKEILVSMKLSVQTWRIEAKTLSISTTEIARMSSAFEH